jgi:hypothetical protein
MRRRIYSILLTYNPPLFFCFTFLLKTKVRTYIKNDEQNIIDNTFTNNFQYDNEYLYFLLSNEYLL